MKNKNEYSFRVEWSEEDDCYIAKCLEFPSLLVHASSRQKAVKELEVVLKETLNWMEEEGEQIPEALSTRNYKGNISLRIPADTHKEITIAAAEKNLSINQLITSLIEKNLYSDNNLLNVNMLQNQIVKLTNEIEEIKNFNTLLTAQFLSMKKVHPDYYSSRSSEDMYQTKQPFFSIQKEDIDLSA